MEKQFTVESFHVLQLGGSPCADRFAQFGNEWMKFKDTC